MVRLLPAMAIGFVLGGLVGLAPAEQNLTEAEVRRLIDENRLMRAQLETQRKQLTDLRARLMTELGHSRLFREELVRRGVDVEELLAPPATQPETTLPTFVFHSPESLAQHLRKHFAWSVRADMTRLQRETAEAQFESWLNSSALLPNKISWVFRVTDAWRARRPEEVTLDYAVDREALVPRLAKLGRTVGELEVLELTVERLKAEQRARRDIHARLTGELAGTPPSHKHLAEQAMRQAYNRLIEINVQLRLAEARYKAERRLARRTRATSKPDEAGYRIMINGRGGRDETIELTVFCHERDASRLMAAPRGSLVKVRGWLTDLAMAERLGTLGLRLDHGEVLAVNVESLPPTPPVQDASDHSSDENPSTTP